jgi:hypothetical protein
MLDFYNRLRSYRDYDFDEPYSRAFSVKTGCDVKLFNLETDLDLLSDMEKETRRFLAMHGLVYVIPLELPDSTVFALTMKAVRTKAFFKVAIDERIPMVFGFGPEFKDFKKGDVIAMSEGVKDALAVKTVYRYSLGYLKSVPDERLWELLKTLTTKIVIFGDNDRAGRKITKNESYSFCGKHFVTGTLGKDVGEYWDNSSKDKRELMQARIRMALDLYQ